MKKSVPLFRQIKISTGIILLSFLTGPLPAKNPERPSFIFILTDDMGWSSTSQAMDSLIPDSKSDYHETPSFERLAQKGMRFTSGYSPCALCCPTRRSIQFGQTPMRQGDDEQFRKNYQPENKQLLTIPRLLKSIDPAYRTAHYGKWDLRSGIFPEDMGYDESDGNTGNKNGDLNSTKETKWTSVFLNNDPKRIETISARAINFIERNANSGNPFYLQISHYATHVDFQTTEELYRKYQQKKKGKIHSNPAWAGMMESLDSGIGRILDLMDDLKISGHTYLFLMSDNGGVEFIPPVRNKFDHPSVFPVPPRNHPLRGGKWTLYEGGIRVPFMVAGPGIKPGSQCNIPVAGWDLLPTFADLAGKPFLQKDDLDGISIRPLLENGNQGTIRRKNDALVFHYFNNPHSAIRVGDYKLIKFWESDRTELYQLNGDPGELTNIATENPGRVKVLETQLLNYMRAVNADYLKSKIVNTREDE